jgi:hypothetical protein
MLKLKLKVLESDDMLVSGSGKAAHKRDTETDGQLR